MEYWKNRGRNYGEKKSKGGIDKKLIILHDNIRYTKTCETHKIFWR